MNIKKLSLHLIIYCLLTGVITQKAHATQELEESIVTTNNMLNNVTMQKIAIDSILPQKNIDFADDASIKSGNIVDTLNNNTTEKLSSKEIAKLEKIQRKAQKVRDMATWKPDPKRAMWLAIILPGAGQVYNRKYWKLPIIYGGFLGCAYAMRWNNQMYLDYSQAYLDIMDDDPMTKSYTQFLHLGTQINQANEERYKQIFKSRKDKYRRWRDLSFFCMLGVYGLSIIDAYVDASLSQFDISDDLSLRVRPSVFSGKGQNELTIGTSKHQLYGNETAIGVQGALVF